MEDSTSSNVLVQEREKLMVNPSLLNKKSHLLKPCSTSIDASKAVVSRQNRSDSSSLDLKALALTVRFTGWRIADINFKSWATKMAEVHKPIWLKAGIFEAVMSSTNNIRKDIDLVLSVAEKWCPETNTFVFSWGEATITLEDVMLLFGFSPLGGPVFADLDSEGENIKAKLETEWCKIAKDAKGGYHVSQATWMKRFMGCGDELEHLAFLALWLCYFVFPSSNYNVYRGVFPVAVHLSRGTRIALAPAVLAHLYAELSILKSHIRDFATSKDIDKIVLKALFKLVEVWTWERFRELQPAPNALMEGETRLALWHDPKYNGGRMRRVRRVLDYSKSDGFEWRPYTKAVENWEFPKFYPERAIFVPVDPNLDDEFVSYARCFKVSQLVGIDCVEHYFPDRVASQFGMHQDVPGPVKRNKLSQKEAWNEYSKPFDDLTFYIPSRYAIGRDTQMFTEWRRKCSSEENLVVEEDETLEPRDMNDKRIKCIKRVRVDEENNIASSSSKMKRTSEKVRKIAANFISKRRKYLKLARDKRRKCMKRASENDESAMAHCQKQITTDNDESVVGRCQKQIAVDNDEDSDDRLTISQLMNKYKNVTDSGEAASKWLGEKSRLEVDINDSGPSQKPESLLLEDGAIIGEKARSGEKKAIEELTPEAHNNEAAPSQKLANEDVDELDLANDPSYQKSLQNLQEMSDSIEKDIEEAKRNVAWLKEQKAIRKRNLEAARLI